MPRKHTGRPRGAPPGNRNALKTGAHTGELRAMRRLVREQIALARALIAQVPAYPIEIVVTHVTAKEDDAAHFS